jgi:biotin operon repressor
MKSTTPPQAGRNSDTPKKRTPYGITPWSFLLDHMRELELPPLAILLWGLIDQSCGKDQTCWKSHETLARELGTSPATVKRYISRLDRAGLLVIEKRPGRTSLLRTINPARQETSTVGVVENKETEVTQVTQHLGHSSDLRELPLTNSPTPPPHIIIETNTRSERFVSLTIREINKRAKINLDPSNQVIEHINHLAKELTWLGQEGAELSTPELIGEVVKHKLKDKQRLGTIKSLEGYTSKVILPHITSADLNEARTRIKKFEAHKLELIQAGIA